MRAILVAVATVCGAAAVAGAAGRHESPITPVTGPSTLQRHGLTVEHTSMGFTERLGPGADEPLNDDEVAPFVTPARAVTVSGADLYRLNCRACHRANGEGSPPEISTLIEPVRGTSVALWEQRMRELDRPIDPGFAKQVVSTARVDLFKRLTDGGQKMPSFAYLEDNEVQALFAYLELLAGVPGAAQRQRSVVVPATRVGEYVVKGTCHICHDATGAWPAPAALANGIVPPLGAMPARHSASSVIRKVRVGAPVMTGTTRLLYRGRMPVFDYVSNDEAAAAYLFLTAYPPRH
jgi:mono/diheme cytochrome c family protein